MQIVIDIDDGIAQGIIDGQGDEPSKIVRSFQATIADAIKSGTSIPDNATNGDMIKAVFGAKDKDENFVIQTITVTMSNARKTFGRDWWYAPFKKEVEE